MLFNLTKAAVAVITLSTAGISLAQDAPRYQVDDSYEFASPKGNYILTVTSEEDGVYTLSFNGDARLKIDDNASVVAVKVPVNGTYEWMNIKPHAHNYQFPLDEGKTWSGSYEWVLGQWSGTDSLTARVGKSTELEFAGGKIAAIPVYYEVQSRPNGAASTRITTTCWYAPAIGYTAKCESSSPRFQLHVVGYAPAAKVPVGSSKD